MHETSRTLAWDLERRDLKRRLGDQLDRNHACRLALIDARTLITMMLPPSPDRDRTLATIDDALKGRRPVREVG